MGRLHALQVPPQQLPRLLQATWEAGDAALVLPQHAPAPHLAAVLDRLRPSTVRTVDGVTSRRQDGLPVDDGVALVVATSGSTGTPKGVELSHAALLTATRAGLRRLDAHPGERWGLTLPTHHVAGVAVLLRAWELGTEPVIVEELDALATRELEHLALVPTQLVRLLATGVDLRRFRRILVGGGPLATELRERARAAGGHVVESYGMTETAGGCVYDGLPLDGVEVGLADGRIRIRGPVLFRGYRGAEAGTPGLDADGWFTTGDLGRMTHGHLEVLGRADDVAVSGGENVVLGTIERTLATHPEVGEVAVTVRPDDTWGQAVVAVVVPRVAGRPPSLTTLRNHVSATHPRSWAPQELVLVAALPRDDLGKVTRGGLTALLPDPAPGSPPRRDGAGS